jgi:cellulose synthase/poly-beta-1,6-N-acetylglucosamine synthase-like glycosyltransferase
MGGQEIRQVSVATLDRGPDRRTVHLVLPDAPSDAEKTSYAWRSLPLLTAALVLSSACVIAAQLFFEMRNPIALPFALYTLLYLVYQTVSLPVNFAGGRFDLAEHQRRVRAWQPDARPTVDIFLPVCGEPIDVLRNTWAGVAELIDAYPGVARGFVLDDGPGTEEIHEVAVAFGLGYLRRPNVGHHKKSGNLAYGLACTRGQHVVIFDADFRPRPDFLAETLPYMDNPSTGLVQTPQYFRVSKNQTWVEKGAGATLEIFYRAVQVSRNRFGSALCVGSNAVYRRKALEAAGGFTEIPYAEDSHTGLDMRYAGYQLSYVPMVLAAGVCPSTMDTYMRQQYRWCCGATSLMWTRHMWRVKMPWTARLPYVAGWLWNLTTAVRTIVLPLIPITLLAFLPGEIRLRNAVLLIPVIVTGTILYPLWHHVRWSVHVWPLAIAVGWAQALAIWDYARGNVMSWVPSRSPKDANRRFRKAVLLWNGTLAIVWVVLAMWRIEQTMSIRFAAVAFFGLLNLVIISRVVLPGKHAE